MRRVWSDRLPMAAAVVALVATLVPVPLVVAADDTVAPTGTLSVLADDRVAGTLRLGVPATDDASGVATVEVSSTGTTWAAFPYAATVDWPAYDPAAGGVPGTSRRTVSVRWTDGAGNVSDTVSTTVDVFPYLVLEYPLAAVTGSPFTIRPVFPTGTTVRASADCSYELLWGDNRALVDQVPNETYGSLFVNGTAAAGYCAGWTLTLPWVPYPQFQVYFNSPIAGTNMEPATLPRFRAVVASTDRRIRASSLPMVQLLPDRYTIIVGEPVTYRAYPVGGADLHTYDVWHAYWPGAGIYRMQTGGSTFTFTPPVAGNWLIAWNARFRPYLMGAAYDPPARYRDSSRPNTTAPVQRIDSGHVGATIPISLMWTGTDRGWGIDRFQLQRSTDGGAWTAVVTTKAKMFSQAITTGHSYRYRVRAIDRAGNIGYWDYGATFRPRNVGEGSTWLTYRGAWTAEADPTALGGALRSASGRSESVTLKFFGRDVAWVAERDLGRGQATVYVDGTRATTVDLGTTAADPRRIVFRRHWGASGSHTIRIVVVGTLGRPSVDVDGFVVLR